MAFGARCNTWEFSPDVPHVLHLTSHLDARFGGTSVAVPDLCQALAQEDRYQVTLAAFCQESECIDLDANAITLLRFRQSWPLANVPASLRKAARTADIIHVHGLWEQQSGAAAYCSARFQTPMVVSAHGMLDRWALQRKRWKKELYATLFERRYLRRASCLHALTDIEAADYRQFRLSSRIETIPNGIHLHSASPEVFLNQYPVLRDRPIILFLGRLHPKKGLDLLCQAWNSLAHTHPTAHLVIAGPDSHGYAGTLQKHIATAHLQHRTHFVGLLKGTLKWSALAAATVFTLPSYSEGFSVATLEAMAAGTPVIASKACNFPAIDAHQCGRTIDVDADALENALNQILSLPERERRQMGERARTLVSQNYSWPDIARRMASLYDSLLMAR